MAKVYNHQQKIEFQISSDNLISKPPAEKLIKKFRNELENLEISEPDYIAKITDVDEFWSDFIEPMKIFCGFTICWHIIDTGIQEFSAFRWNNVIRNKLASEIKDIRLKKYFLTLDITRVKYH